MILEEVINSAKVQRFRKVSWSFSKRLVKRVGSFGKKLFLKNKCVKFAKRESGKKIFLPFVSRVKSKNFRPKLSMPAMSSHLFKFKKLHSTKIQIL
jgi:hypothetical protein